MNEAGDYLRTLCGIEVFQWNPARGADDVLLGNVGDLLGPLVVERMLWRRSPLRSPSQPRGSRLFSIGSVLHFARNGDVVWGTGINGKALPTPLTQWPRLDVRSVRGPWTARLLANAGLRVPSVFGDPALLVGRLFPELGGWARHKIHDTLVVPNFNDMPSYEDADYDVLAPTEPLWTVLRAVAKSRFVAGSSLHAVAVADALGVPARFVASENEDPFKYRDYLAGTGRPTTRVAESVQHALDLGPHRVPEVDLDALERAFPWDMWSIESDDAEDAPPEFVPGTMHSAWLERMAHEGGAREAVRHFFAELVPEIRRAAVAGAPRLESLVSRAYEYCTEVAPEVVMERIDHDLKRIVEAIGTRDAALVRLAVLLSGSSSLALLRGTRVSGSYLIVEVVLHDVRALATATSLELVLTGQSTGRVVRQPMTLFEVQRTQWHVDIDVMVDMALLGDDETWVLAVEVEGPEPVLLDLVSAPPASLGLLALERGNLSADAPLAIVTKDGTDFLPAPQAVVVA